MIQCISPLRISFMGGRTDFPSFYTEEEGFVVSTTIDKYIRFQLQKREQGIRFAQIETEEVSLAEELKNPLVRGVLQYLSISTGIEIQASCDTPSGTGLGSSSSFTVGLLKALQTITSAKDLAEIASLIEIDMLRINTGKQDPYAAAFGGFNGFRFLPDGSVEVKPIFLETEIKKRFESSLCVYYTGIRRDGAKILEQERGSLHHSKLPLRAMRDLAKDFYHELKAGADLVALGQILDMGWNFKKSISNAISNSFIEDAYQKALQAGAYGGKLLGAGGGGFLLFICPLEKQENLQKSLSSLKRLPIAFSNEGARILEGV